ncbi:MAG: hypothetical protein RL569_765 [Actinomycetota bacterium]|jgi:cytochrome b involved in lipid metabolism
MAQINMTSNLFDTFGGLPLHPLAVHGAVVLLPLSALALALMIFVPEWRKSFFPLTLIGLGLSTIFTFIAKESGEALGERVGEPQTHESLGEILFPASVGLLALGVAFFFLQRGERPKWQLQVAAGLALAGIISVSTLTYFVGHSGAEATWASRIAPYEAPVAQETAPAESVTGAEGISLVEIAQHATREDCWTAIDSTVYDLTPYMQQHPGGAGSLAWLCGSDGTSAFKGQHGSEQRPATELASLAIGVYAGAVATDASATDPATEPTPTPSATAQAGSFSAAEVAKHNSATNCWSVVNGKVYDLTSYVSSHPGGSSVIKAICGKDGTAAFSGQHAGAARPNNTLDGFLLGTLASSAAGTSTLQPAPAQVGGEEGEEEEEGEEHD